MAIPSPLYPMVSFKPRAREGRDGQGGFEAINLLEFQATRPRGARLIRHSGFAHRFAVSSHAPARGATSGLVA